MNPSILSDEEAQKDLREDERQKIRQLAADLRLMLGAEWGRRIFYWLVFDLGGIESASFNQNIKDGYCAALHSALAEGRRDFARGLLVAATDLCPSEYLEMLKTVTLERAADLARRNLRSAGEK